MRRRKDGLLVGKVIDLALCNEIMIRYFKITDPDPIFEHIKPQKRDKIKYLCTLVFITFHPDP